MPRHAAFGARFSNLQGTIVGRSSVFDVRRNFQPMDTNGIDASHPKLIRSGGTSPTKLHQLSTRDTTDVAVSRGGLNHFGAKRLIRPTRFNALIEKEVVRGKKIKKRRKRTNEFCSVRNTEKRNRCRTSKIIYRLCVYIVQHSFGDGGLFHRRSKQNSFGGNRTLMTAIGSLLFLELPQL